MTAAVTALDWWRRANDEPERVPSTPVGPDLARGLSQDFGFDAFESLPWETALEVDLLLTHGDRGPLPARAVVELEGENQARADVAAWPNLSDALNVRPLPLPDLPWMRNSLAHPHASGSVLERSDR